jgi:hypothetical protein
MTGAEALTELLDRIGASREGIVYIGDHELRQWPSATVAAFKKTGLLAAASPASSVVCPGCERQCTMPVHVLPAADAFVVCDKRSDINRVPVEAENLTRWQTSGEAVAALLARLLRLRRRPRTNAMAKRWEVGAFKGQKRASHLLLTADGNLKLGLAGHVLELADVLSIKGTRLAVDVAALTDRVDEPASGGGDIESAERRRARLEKRLATLKAEGNRRFLQTVAREEGISVQRLKQITAKRIS